MYPHWEENFRSYFEPLVKRDDFAGKLVLDAGCGFGRHAFYAAKFGAEVLAMDLSEAVEAAYENPDIIHQVEAPAGSTMLMCETLIHATGQNRTDDERMIIIAGFSHPKHMAMANWEPTPEFLATVPEKKKQLVAGHPFWTWPERHRHLGMPASQEEVPYRARMWSVSHERE